MKKWTAFLLALALCGNLAACGGGNNAQADSTEGKTETVETVKPEDTAEKDEQAEKDAADNDQADADQPTSQQTQQGAASGSGSSTTAGSTTSSGIGSTSGNTSSNKGSGSAVLAQATARQTADQHARLRHLRRAGTCPEPEPERPPRPLQASVISAARHPRSRVRWVRQTPRAIRPAAWERVRTASGATAALPSIPTARTASRPWKRYSNSWMKQKGSEAAFSDPFMFALTTDMGCAILN